MENRREFLKKLGVAGCSVVLLGKLDLSAVNINNLSPINLNSNDYKALVHIMLLGGNDSANMLVDYEEEAYNDYKAVRPGMAIRKQDLIALQKSQSKYAVHPKMENIAQMFDNEELAFIANVGAVIEPTTKDNLNTVKLPEHLFSHSSQQLHWQNLSPDEIVKTGWGGRIADALNFQSPDNLPPIYGMNSDSVWLKANNTHAYIFDTTGANSILTRKSQQKVKKRVNELQEQYYSNALIKTYRDLFKGTLQKSQVLSDILSSSALTINLTLKNDFAEKLKLIAKIVDLRESFGFPRQMFHIGLGGFDTHTKQQTEQPKLFNMLDKGLKDFNQALKDIQMFNNVTTVITSDFGRTLSANETGTDHGWGGHYFVMGGAVKGGKVYGQMPSLKDSSTNLTNTKRLIPDISVEQYIATICRWYGLQENNLDEIFPNLKNFSQRDLGFMKL
jgi:uncharacterized protein (DUF1501 family)